MSLRRVRPWDWATGVLGLVLLGLLESQWYERLEGGVSAYDVFGVVDVLLVILAALAASVVIAAAAARRPAVALPFPVIATALAWLLALLVLYRIVNQPGRNADVSVSTGAWLGLACVLAIGYAGYRALRDQRAPAMEPGPAPERQPVPALGSGTHAEP